MRCSVIFNGISTPQAQDEVRRNGGVNIKIAPASKQIFCDLSQLAVEKLRALGYIVNQIGGIKAGVSVPSIVSPPTPVAGMPTYTPEELSWATGLEDLRMVTTPPLYGEGFNIAIIGTGIRETHNRIKGSVIYSKNYTNDPMRDGLDHDTGICNIILVMAPLCGVLNLKVLDDKGNGTEEMVTMAIEDCIALWNKKPEIAPCVINLSLGGPDDGNPNNPLRLACRAAIDRGIWVFASAGNSGPAPYTITNPATERYVFAIGSASYEPFGVSYFSSRGPTIEGLTKPDGILFGENIVMASSASDSATIAKSGTSFATPFASGMGLLYLEGALRQVHLREELAGLPVVTVPAEVLYQAVPSVIIDEYLPMICVKPAEVPRGKDNDYGYGLPYGPIAYRVLTLGPSVAAELDISTMLQNIAPILGIGMLGMVMVPIVKEFK